MDHGLGKPALVPRQIDLESAARTQAFHRSTRPGFGKGGKKIELMRFGLRVPNVTLQEHLGDAGAGPEIAVHLERTTLVEQIRKSPLAELKRELPHRHLPVGDARPQGNSPRVAPTRAPVATP